MPNGRERMGRGMPEQELSWTRMVFAFPFSVVDYILSEVPEDYQVPGLYHFFLLLFSPGRLVNKYPKYPSVQLVITLLNVFIFAAIFVFAAPFVVAPALTVLAMFFGPIVLPAVVFGVFTVWGISAIQMLCGLIGMLYAVAYQATDNSPSAPDKKLPKSQSDSELSGMDESFVRFPEGAHLDLSNSNTTGQGFVGGAASKSQSQPDKEGAEKLPDLKAAKPVIFHTPPVTEANVLALLLKRIDGVFSSISMPEPQDKQVLEQLLKDLFSKVNTKEGITYSQISDILEAAQKKLSPKMDIAKAWLSRAINQANQEPADDRCPVSQDSMTKFEKLLAKKTSDEDAKANKPNYGTMSQGQGVVGAQLPYKRNRGVKVGAVAVAEQEHDKEKTEEVISGWR